MFKLTNLVFHVACCRFVPLMEYQFVFNLLVWNVPFGIFLLRFIVLKFQYYKQLCNRTPCSFDDIRVMIADQKYKTSSKKGFLSLYKT